MAQAKTTNSEKATGAATYKKEQLVASKRYANRRDLIRALLEDGKAYTLNEVDGHTFRRYPAAGTAARTSPWARGSPWVCLSSNVFSYSHSSSCASN